jgi:hypothetical protein
MLRPLVEPRLSFALRHAEHHVSRLSCESQLVDRRERRDKQSR